MARWKKVWCYWGLLICAKVLGDDIEPEVEKMFAEAWKVLLN